MHNECNIVLIFRLAVLQNLVRGHETLNHGYYKGYKYGIMHVIIWCQSCSPKLQTLKLLS